MTSAREFHAFACLRGEGLHQKIRDLLDRAATSRYSEVHARHDGMLQSGPDLQSEVPAPGNIASFSREKRPFEPQTSK
jgi:hypothetical protein